MGNGLQIGTTLRRRLLGHLRARLGDARLPLRVTFWDGDSFDFAPSPEVTIAIGSARVQRLFLSGNMDRLGAAYVEGEVGVEGRLQDILRIGITIAERIGGTQVARRAAWVLEQARRLRPRHTKRGDAAAISYHYDVSNEFYALWLDRRMIYSCAFFRTGQEDIDTAQEQKLDHLCRKLRLVPGERLLDIGCGWGGLLIWAARHHGVSGVGVTLSEQQCEYARARVAAEGLGNQIEIRLQDYRDIPGDGSFDKIVSVGMYEHVGIAKLPIYFAAVARLLKPGGIALNHGITTTDRDGVADGPPGGEFINRFVFPGGELPHISRVLYEIAGSGLEPFDLEDLRPHYPRTLLRWVSRLEARRDAVIAAGGEQRYRIWRIYLAGMAYAFDRGMLSVAQVLACKPDAAGPAARPWTRAYQEDAGCQAGPGGEAPLAGALDWGEI